MKYVTEEAIVDLGPVSPLRGEWIEISSAAFASGFAVVSPLRGEWIEIAESACALCSVLMSRLSEASGLKSPLTPPRDVDAGSRLSEASGLK